MDSSPAGDDEGIDFAHLLAVLLEDKWLILAVAALVMLAASVYLFSATPIYKVDALVQVEDDRKTLKGLEGLSSLFEGEASSTAELEILQSRMVLGQVVENLKLDQSAAPRYFPVIGAGIARHFKAKEAPLAKPWFNLGQFAWGGEKIRLDTLIVPDYLLGKPLTLVAGESGRYALLDPDDAPLLEGRIGQPATLERDGHQKLQVFVSQLQARPGTHFVVKRVPQLAAIKGLQANLTAKEKGKQSQVLEITLRGPDPAAVRDTLNDIANTYLRQNVERRSEEAEKRLAFVQRQLPELKQQLDIAENAFNTYRQQHGSVDLDTETKSLLEGIVELETDIRELDLKRAELLNKLQPTHPYVKAVDSQIAEAKADLADMNKRTTSLPDTQQEVLRFSRDVQVNTELYTALLNNAQELRIAKAGSIGTVRIIDYAMAPIEADSPKTMRVRLLSVIGGLILGIGLAFLRRTFRRGVEDPEEVEALIDLPVYANVPHSPEEEKLTKRRWVRRGQADRAVSIPLAEQFPDSDTTESLRSLRTALHFAMLDARSRSILLTGPAPGIGKSFLSANLAVVLAQAGQRTLLIDADLRKGHLHRSFGLDHRRGVSEFVSEAMPLDAVVHETQVAGLHLIPTGQRPPNPSELLMHERFAAMIQEAERRYDLVVIDSPPILAATDAAIVGQCAGATLLVVRAGTHHPRELKDAVKRMVHGGVNLRGVIFNDMPISKNRYGYGYGYGYGKYAYRYSYTKS